MNEQSSVIRKIQLAELNIMKQVLPIIEKYHLRYFMLGGTLLGAVRHQGFIPWDDDMDIGMPRPDYEFFLQVAERELQSPYQIHTLHNHNGEYAYYYARIEDCTIKVKRSLTARDVVIPIWLDVFPLDGVPEGEKAFQKWKRKCERYRFLFAASQFEYSFNVDKTKRKRNQAFVILTKKAIVKTQVYHLINTEWAWKCLDKALKTSDYETSERIINYCGAWKYKEMFPKSVYGKGKLYQFEDLMLMGPEDYDTVLKQMYGDYMTPPPENERNHHSIEYVVQ